MKYSTYKLTFGGSKIDAFGSTISWSDPNAYHTITLTTDGNGSIQSTTLTGRPGETATLNTNYSAYYRFKDYGLTGGGSIEGNTYTFGTSDATMSNGFIRNYFPGSADRNFKIKYIFYKRKNSLAHNPTTQMLDYCLYDNYVSAYRSMGYLGIGDGVNDMILRNNSAFFEFASTANHSVYSTSASTTTFYNVEFFHTSSYYDALNG